ncbi:MAG: hypothetical protein OEM28_02515 [Nitrosopumilus sp.]|nr:hypothetical protein [Nitrosopumilus sp.]
MKSKTMLVLSLVSILIIGTLSADHLAFAQKDRDDKQSLQVPYWHKLLLH